MRLLLLRFLCGLCFLAASNIAFAAVYTWTADLGGYVGTGISPGAACSAAVSRYNSLTQTEFPIGLGRVIPVPGSNNTFTCFLLDHRGNEGTSGIAAIRSGDSCPTPDHQYNPQTGECDPPPPDCSGVSPGIFRSPDAAVVNSNGSNYVLAQSPGEVCYGQCAYETSSRASSCFYVSGSTSSGFCNYVGTATGANCSSPDSPLGQTGDPLNPPDTPDVPPSDPNDPGCPPGYGWSGTTCAKNPDDNGNPPGDGSGGDGGDGGDTGGGGGVGGGGDGSGGDGSGGDGSGGDGSGGDGSGGETGGGGPGGGGGSGDGSDDEDEDPKSSVGGESCSATITCEGDAIQCAILRSQKMQACADQEARDYSKAAPTINAEIAKAEYQLKEETVDASGFFNLGTRFYSSTCPAPKSLRIESIGRTIQLSYQPLCDFAGALSYIVVAMASLFFMVYVGRSFGGE